MNRMHGMTTIPAHRSTYGIAQNAEAPTIGSQIQSILSIDVK